MTPPAYSPGLAGRVAASQSVVPAYFPQPRRRKRDRGDVGLDNATPWLLILYLGLQVYKLIQWLIANSDSKQPVGVLLTGLITDTVLFFMLVATAVWLAAFLASKVMKFGLVEAAYLKAAGVAAVPSVAVGLMLILPRNPLVIVLLLLAIIPVAFYVFKFAFALEWNEALIGFLFAGPLYVGAQFACIFLDVLMIAMAASGGKITFPSGGDAKAQQAAQQPADATPSWDEEWRARSVAAQFEAYKNEIASLSSSLGPDPSREAMLQRIDATRARIDSSKATLGNENYANLLTLIDQAKQNASSLPSRMPDPSVFRDPVASQVWETPADSQEVGKEVSLQNFKLRPPADGLIDLKSSETGSRGLVWKFRQSWPATLSVILVPCRNVSQRQPWLIDHAFMAQENERQDLFAIDLRFLSWHEAGVDSSAEAGKIHGVVFTRVVSVPIGDRSMNRWAQYVARSGNQWLVATLVSPGNEGRLFGEMQAAAESIRRADGEPHIDPFSPATLIARLAEEPVEASALLRRKGAAAETALDEALKGPQPRIAEGAAAILKDLATRQSLPVLRGAAASNDQAVRIPVRRPAPADAEGI